MPVSGEELLKDNYSNVVATMDKHGITLDALLAQAKKELKAKNTKTVKIKGAVSDLPKGRRKVAESDEETLIEWEEKDWGTRQRARIDLHKLRGDYPAERHEMSGSITLDTGIRRPGDEEE